MIHRFTTNEHSFKIKYQNGIEPEDAETLSYELIEFIKSKAHRVNLILDLSDGFLTDLQTIYVAVKRVKPFMNRLNICYVVGGKGLKMTFLKNMFKLLAANDKKIVFVHDTNEAELDAEKRWQIFKKHE